MQHEEKLFLATVLGISALMVVGSYRYSPIEAMMPRTASILVFFFSAIILVQEYTSIQPADGSADLSETMTDMVNEEERDDDPFGISREARKFRFGDITFSFRILVAALLTVYVVLGYLIGLYWSSLLFVFLYSRFAGLNKWRTAGLLLFTFGALYVFGALLDVPVTAGYLLTTVVNP